MVPGELDERLRDAFALARQPVATAQAVHSVATALPRYRARRRAKLGAIGVSIVGVLGLTAGLVARDQGSTPNQVAQSGCVSVQVGASPPTCVGSIESMPASTAQLSPSVAAGALGVSGAVHGPDVVPPRSAGTELQASAGTHVFVSLPIHAGARWTGVFLDRVIGPSGAQRSFEEVGALTVHQDRHTGRTTAVWMHTTPGLFVLVASTPPSCAQSAPSCVPRSFVWSITLRVP